MGYIMVYPQVNMKKIGIMMINQWILEVILGYSISIQTRVVRFDGDYYGLVEVNRANYAS